MTLELLFGLFLGATASGVVPIINAELIVLAAAIQLSSHEILVVAGVAASGQMIAKTALYGLARWVPSRLPLRARTMLEGASTRYGKRGGAAGLLVFGSASVGLPPFYGVSLACGALRVRLATFVAFGLAGRLVRFAFLAWSAVQLAGLGSGVRP